MNAHLRPIETMGSAKYIIKEAVQAIRELDFGEDICSINRYIQKRMQNDDISKTIKMERPDISPAVCSLLQHSQPITAFEKIFFMLGKLFAKDRNFMVKNVRQYMILHFSSRLWSPSSSFELFVVSFMQEDVYIGHAALALTLCLRVFS